MALDEATVRKIARLARIEVADDQLEALGAELSHILDWVELLGEVDTDGVAPMASVVEIELPLRQDEVTDGGYPEKLLDNAPDQTKGFFTVPKVIE